MPETLPPGRFVWHELMTTEPDLAARFYPKVTGWKLQPSAEDPSYRLWMSGKRPVGGLMTLPPEAKSMGERPHWMPYIAVADVDDTVRQAQAQGGRVHLAPRDSGWGRFAGLADPQGAAFSVFHPERPDENAATAETPGDFSWHELAAGDWRTAWAFYQRLFGWEEAESMDMGASGTYFMFRQAGTKAPIGGMYTKPSDMPAPPHWLSYVFVADADAAARNVKGAGGSVLNGPMDVPGGGRIAQCLDPQGAAFAVHAAAATPRQPPRKAKPKLVKRATAKKATKAKATKAKAKKAKTKTKATKAKKKAPARKKPARRARARRR
jgi:predicted enzyme related to lactoylglutathione lyase